MPRKTDSIQVRTQLLAVASMRPRPDAAENRRLAAMFLSGLPALQ